MLTSRTVEDVKGEKMLTFRTVEDVRGSLVKLVNSNEITDIDVALEIAAVRPEIDLMINKLSKGLNAIEFKYGKMAEKRKDKDNPKGYLLADELKAKSTELEEFYNRPVGVNVEFPELPKEVYTSLYNNKGEKDPQKGEFIFSTLDLSSFMILGMIPNKKKK